MKRESKIGGEGCLSALSSHRPSHNWLRRCVDIASGMRDHTVVKSEPREFTAFGYASLRRANLTSAILSLFHAAHWSGKLPFCDARRRKNVLNIINGLHDILGSL
eukprot:5231402-Pleurochrysis_carterae.AAC.1